MLNDEEKNNKLLDSVALTGVFKRTERRHGNQSTLKTEEEADSPPKNGCASQVPGDRYKTELCNRWEESGSCHFGKKCKFAHGKEDLRIANRHPKYKTEYCTAFTIEGLCPYGARCLFIHPKFSLGQGASEGKRLSRRLPVFEQICPSSPQNSAQIGWRGPSSSS